jgi:hypothetical protein
MVDEYCMHTVKGTPIRHMSTTIDKAREKERHMDRIIRPRSAQAERRKPRVGLLETVRLEDVHHTSTSFLNYCFFDLATVEVASSVRSTARYGVPQYNPVSSSRNRLDSCPRSIHIKEMTPDCKLQADV